MNAPTSDELRVRDLAAIWHPCTQMKDHEALLPMVPVRSGHGVWLEGYAGERYLDAISSWWVNLFGHAHPGISSAIARQAERLPHVMFAGFTHAPAIELAERLINLTPPGLDRCFFADNGSAAVEVALKMSFHYWRNLGQPQKQGFVTLANSYHGETLGALAVSDVGLYKSVYEPLLMPVHSVPSPDRYLAEPGESPAQHARRQAQVLEELLSREAHNLAALIVEPLVQCAGSMRMYDPLYLKLAADLCRRHHVHLIVDEIAVGFGRTGTLFACEQAGISPDFLCLSKGLTGGYLPLSVVMLPDAVYQAFYADFHPERSFLHSHSYTGNALACAAALATLDIFAEQPVLERNAALAKHLARGLERFWDYPQVADVRQTGLIAAIELVQDRNARRPYPASERRHLAVYRYAMSRGVLLRPLGGVIYFMPPYVITEAEIDLMLEVAWEAIQHVYPLEA